MTALNDLLHQYGKHIIGRMGVPYHTKRVNIISVAMDAPADVVSALSGRLGRLPGVTPRRCTRGGGAAIKGLARPFRVPAQAQRLRRPWRLCRLEQFPKILRKGQRSGNRMTALPSLGGVSLPASSALLCIPRPRFLFSHDFWELL